MLETFLADEDPDVHISPQHLKQILMADVLSQERSPSENIEEGHVQSTAFTAESLEAKGVMEMLRVSRPKVVPDWYIKPPHLRQAASKVESAAKLGEGCSQIPVVDLASSSHEELVKAMAIGCEWGFFQIVNHGLPKNLLEKVASNASEFFSLPTEVKLKCTTKAKVVGPVHFGGGTKGDWRDVLKLQCAPASAVSMDYWPTQPTDFTETLLLFTSEQQALVVYLLELISESLGLKKGYIEEVWGVDRRVLVAINHYPPCPDPSLTMGIREHSDPNTITLLLQDQVGGLQVYKEGRWIELKPLDNAVVVNVGDHLQILSNGKYPSCLHRVVNNKIRSRTSIATFFSPSLTSHVGPAPALVDEEHPAVYRNFVYKDFLADFYRNGGPNKKVILSRFQNS